VTCAECQDLLLDLAYGELDAARAAEVEAHIAGCADCQRERAGIAGVRTLVAPLLKTEEPSAEMDEVILRAARDEAERMAAGARRPKTAARAAGPRVVEVTAMFAAPQAAARVDVAGQVEVRPPAAPPRRRWLLRAAAVGSLAAAAGLVLVVNDSQRMKSARHGLEEEAAAPREIRIRVPGEAPPATAPKKAEAPKKTEAPRAAPAVERENAELRAKVAELERTRAEASRRSQDELLRRAVEHRTAATRQTPTADAPKLLASRPAEEKSAEQDRAPALAKEAARPQPPPAPAAVASPPAAERAEPAAGAGSVSTDAKNEMAAAPPPAVAAVPRHEAKGKRAAAKSAGIADGDLQDAAGSSRGDAASAAQIEGRARAARHGGAYAEAALLYRQAAALHRRAAESGQQHVPTSNQAPALDVPAAPRRDATAQVVPQKAGPATKDQFAAGQGSLMAASWALAHAVECLAADAQTDEARRVYDDLLIHYSFAQGPIAAAARALRIASPQRPAAAMPNAAEPAPARQQTEPTATPIGQ
jgi:anti-sigma factor RsiW